jgi:hypothetical protein
MGLLDGMASRWREPISFELERAAFEHEPGVGERA